MKLTEDQIIDLLPPGDWEIESTIDFARAIESKVIEQCASICEDLAFTTSLALAARNSDGSNYYDHSMVRIAIDAQSDCAEAIRSDE